MAIDDITGPRRYEICLESVEKYFTSEWGEGVKLMSTREEKFHNSWRPCNVQFTKHQ